MSTVLSLAVVDGEPRIDSRLIASQLGTEHKNTRELIEQYQADFEEFGVCPFETAKPPKGSNGGRPEKFALLNEDQSYLLLTYCQNTEQARDLKKRLVQAFSECRRQLQPTTKPAPKLTREERYRLGVYRDAVKTAELIGLSGNMARLAADAYCKNTLGCSVLEPLGATHLLANEQGRVYTPTELGQMLAVQPHGRRLPGRYFSDTVLAPTLCGATVVAKKQSGDSTASLAGKILSGAKKPTKANTKTLAASVLSQDERKGKKKPK